MQLFGKAQFDCNVPHVDGWKTEHTLQGLRWLSWRGGGGPGRPVQTAVHVSAPCYLWGRQHCGSNEEKAPGLGRKIPEWTAVCISVPFYYLQERQHCDLPDEEVLGPGWDRPGWTAAFVMVGCSVISTETQEHTDTNKARKLNQHQQTHKTHTTHCLTCETLTSEILREKNTVSMPSTNALLSSDRCTEITAITLLPHGHIIFVPYNFVSSFGQYCHLQMPTKKQVHFQSADK